jgi:hypothetical protein
MRLRIECFFPFIFDALFTCQYSAADASQLICRGPPAMEESLVDFRLGKQSI